MDQNKQKRGQPPDTIAGPSNRLQGPAIEAPAEGPAMEAPAIEADEDDKSVTLPIYNAQGYSDEEELEKQNINPYEMLCQPGENIETEKENLELNEISGVAASEEMEIDTMNLNEPPTGTENLNLNEASALVQCPTGSKEMENENLNLQEVSAVSLCTPGEEDTKKENLNLNPVPVLGPYPPGELRVMAGAVKILGSSIRRNRKNPQLRALADFCRDHQWGNEKINGERASNGAVHLVVLNVPSGTPVYGVSDGGAEIPSWNTLPASLIRDAMLVASTILADSGWFVCVHTTDQLRKIDASAAADAVIQRAATFTMVSNLPIYCQSRPPQRIYTLLFSVFHRRGVTPEPKPYYLQAAQLRHGECSITRDTMLERMDKSEWLRRAEDGKPWRGGAQRSDNIWRFLVLAFTKYGDSVVDLIAGTGGLLKVASKLGRHALGIEGDHLILQEVLKHSQLIQ
ncbi:hypothetical protein KI387_034382 [Taxus chinensis]|uniref:Methyltransferase n=1 Tax=Taxus chinensis TaxID=29808 RepID=A0AA38BUV5_TAXCH|nr:hypothetical protein KI387_034382 [Taxus chinensis]